MPNSVYLAVDLGASSGRNLAGVFDGRRLELAQVHRFENTPVHAAGTMHWDLLRLWKEVCEGLRIARSSYFGKIRSVGVDTWGVDFALLGRNDVLLGNPVHYRDTRTEGVFNWLFEEISREEVFEQTGLQFMPINTLYQLAAMKRANSQILEMAESMLMMGDLFHWLLTGVKTNEITNASTTQFFNPHQGAWATPLFDRLGLPQHLLGRLTQPGTSIGPLRPEVAALTGLKDIDVVLPATHDTASAVLAVPAEASSTEKPDWCYISSGTWSLMGVELNRPVINPKCLELNFTNEGGFGGTTRLLKNIAGLWLVQECRRIWNSRDAGLDWLQLGLMADEAKPLASIIDPDDPTLMAPIDMPNAIRDLCRKSGQPVPESQGAVIRCALESLAMKYRVTLERLQMLADTKISTIHIVGGGTQNRQLCQMTANACGCRVLAGPIEATAIGNILVQAIAAGDIGSIPEARRVVHASFAIEEYEPQDSEAWQEAYGNFKQRWGY